MKVDLEEKKRQIRKRYAEAGDFVKRFFEVESGSYNAETRQLAYTFSSEKSVERWGFKEILSHRDGACDLSFCSGKAPLLLNHDENQQIGKILKAEIVDGRGKGVAQISRSRDDIALDIQDGIRENISCAYSIEEFEIIAGQRDDEPDTIHVTKWKVWEHSFVAIPADETIGFGRSKKANLNPEGDDEMAFRTNGKATSSTAGEGSSEGQNGSSHSYEDGGNLENKRLREIMKICRSYDREDLIDKYSEDRNLNPDNLRHQILEEMGGRRSASIDTKASQDFVSAGERREFSFLRAMRGMIDKDWSNAGYEREVLEEARRQCRGSHDTIYIPTQMLRATELSTSVPGYAPEFVDKTLSKSYIELLRSKLVLRELGAQVMTGLEGDLSIPKQLDSATAYWMDELNEDGAPRSRPKVGDVGLTPKVCMAHTVYTRKWLNQSSIDAEQFVRNDLAAVMARAIDRAGLFGLGGNQPAGITTLIPQQNRIQGGNNLIGYQDVVNLESIVETQDANIGAMAYLTGARVKGTLKSTEVTPNSGKFLWSNDEINGYRAYTSNIVSTRMVNGDDGIEVGDIFYGAWDQIIIGEWGYLAIKTDPYSLIDQDKVRIVASQHVDVAVRYPEAFAVIESARVSPIRRGDAAPRPPEPKQRDIRPPVRG